MKNDNVKFKNFKIEIFLILVILFLLPFYFIKFKYGWASLNLVEILIIILFTFWFFDKNTIYPPDSLRDSKRAGQIQNTGYNIPILFIFAGLFLSVIANKNYYSGLGVIKGWFVFPIIFAFILYNNLKKDEKLVDKIFITIFVSGAFVAVEGIYYWFSGLLTYDGRLRIFFDSPNQLAMFLVTPFIVGFLRFGLKKNIKLDLWYISRAFGLFLIGLNLYFTKSYGAWLAIGSTLVIVFWLRYRKIYSKKFLVIVIIIFIILITLAGSGKLENIKNLGDRSSLASRVMIWKSAGLMIQKNLLFGIGPGNFQNKYLEYQKYFPLYLEWAVPQPHNIFLAFWLQSGLAGLVGFIWIILLFFRDNKKARENNPETGLLCLAIILYFLIHGLADTTYWRNDMAIVFWAMMAVNLYFAEDNQRNKSVHSNVNL